jgi:hypothetical protein
MFQHKRDGFYVDIGCHHPFRFSNTAAFYNFFNWSGLNVDVDEDLMAAFDRDRPRDINVCSAVGRERGEAEVTLFHEPAVNSLDAKTIEDFKMHFKVKGTKTVAVLPLRDILGAHINPGQLIDLMTIDVEGLDFDVLLSNDWDLYRPSAIAVEVHHFKIAEADKSPVFQLLTSLGYGLTSHVIGTSIYTLDSKTLFF